MLFGAHVSIAGGISNAPERAENLGCEVFQMFSRAPQAWGAKDITDGEANLFKQNMIKFNQKECYIHAPYLINLASLDNRIRGGSIHLIKEELRRGSQIGAKYVMTHLGSYKDVDRELEGPMMVVDGLKKILEQESSTELLIEISAGAGDVIGCVFDELGYFLEELKGHKIGICLDTAHMFASGYDLRTQESLIKVFDDFDKIVGLENLKLFHLNDSKVGLGERKDRHEHIGEGKIGLSGFKAIILEKRIQHLNFILETEYDKVEQDLKIMKELREKLSHREKIL